MQQEFSLSLLCTKRTKEDVRSFKRHLYDIMNDPEIFSFE